MAAPVVAGVTEGGLTAAGTSIAVTLPAGGADTDLYLIIFDSGSTGAGMNALTGWTESLDETSVNGLKIIRYTGAGVPSNPTFVSSTSTRTVWIAYRITGADKTIAPQNGTTATGTSATPDPPSVTPTGGTSKDYLFIAFAGMAGEEDDDDTWANTPPTNYTPSPPRQKTGGVSGTNIGGLILSAERQLTTGAAENPGTFGVDVSAAWRAQTIIVHPIIIPTATSVARISLASAPTPSARTNHKLYVRARKTAGGVTTVSAALYEGANNRSGDLTSSALTTSLATYTLTIPDVSAANITDYSNLEIRFWGNSSAGSTDSVEIADIWFELPEPAAGGGTITGAGTAVSASTATATAVKVLQGAGTATSTSTATTTAIKVLPGAGVSASTSTATATAVKVLPGAGTATSASTATATAVKVLPGAGVAIGTSTATATAAAVAITGAGTASSTSTATANAVIIPDRAQGKIATAKSWQSSLYLPSKAVDGDAGTRWASDNADNEWWKVDLGVTYLIDRIDVNWEDAYSSYYEIYTSLDDVTYTLATTVSISSPGYKSHTFTPVVAKFVRIDCVTRGTIYGNSFWSVNAYSTSRPDLAQFKTASASSITANAGLAVDEDLTTRWSSGFSEPHWWKVDLGATYDIGEVQILWEDAYGATYNIVTSTDDSTYTLAASITNSSLGLKQHIFPRKNARYVMLELLTRGTAFGFSFYNLEVFTALPIMGAGVATAVSTATATGAKSLVGAGVAASTSTATATAVVNLDRALSKGATASSVAGSNTADKAIDGNVSTKWESTAADNQWWQVDMFGTGFLIDRVDINWDSDYASNYRILTSVDNVTYTQRANVTISGPGLESTTFSAVPAKYIRVEGVTRATAGGISFFTLSAYGAARVDRALGKTASASSEDGAFTADLAVDGEGATRWSSIAANNEWWKVDLGSPFMVDIVSILWDTDYASTYEIYTSLDDSTYTLAAPMVSISASSWKSTYPTAVAARYLRINCLTRATAGGSSFYTVRVDGEPVSAAVIPGAAVSSSVSTATASASKVLIGAGVSASISTATATAAIIASGAGVATSSSTATASATKILIGEAVSTGVSAATASAIKTFVGAGVSTSVSTATASALKVFVSAGAASSSSTATASAIKALIGAGVATSASTAAASALKAFIGAGAATSASTATASALKVLQGAAVSNGISTATANALSYIVGAAIASGSSTATASAFKLLVSSAISTSASNATAMAEIILGDIIPPVPNITVAPSKNRISRVSGQDVTTFTIQSDEAYVEYKLKAVPSGVSPHTAGTLLETATGTFPASTNHNLNITDDELVDAGLSEGDHVVKVFLKDAAGNWST